MVYISYYNRIFNTKPFIQYTKPNLLFMTQNNLNKNITNQIYNPIIGSNLGIPLNILQYIFTLNYYNENIINLEFILLQISIGIFTYGTDRLFDAYNYNISIKDNINLVNKYSNDKINYYNYLLTNFNTNILIIFLSYLYILGLLIQNKETYPLLILLTSTLYYKDFKKNFGQFKAIYIGLFWTIGSVILPCILHDHNYNILSHPYNYLPCFLTMFGSSNLLDIKDINEDKYENINTLPVIFGSKNSIFISYTSILFSIILFSYTDNFYNNIFVSSIYELQNIGLFFTNFNKTI